MMNKIKAYFIVIKRLFIFLYRGADYGIAYFKNCIRKKIGGK